MSLLRRRFLAAAAAGITAPVVLRSGFAQAQVTLRLHHFLPAVSNVHKHFLVPWSEKIATESGGRLKIEIFPSMQLGGAPPQLYDQAKDGVADIIWTLPGNTPGRFPGVEVFELPFIAARRASTNARAVQEFYETYLRAEFAEVHPITVWAYDHGLIHTNKPIRTMADLKGLKLRAATRLNGESVKALGANPIPMPIPQVPEALAQKVIDGTLMPWEVVPAVKVHELVKYHTEIPGSPTLFTATFVLGMNKAKYASLPADLKAVLDANSGQTAAFMASKVWDEQASVVSDMAKKRGNIVSSIAPEEVLNWRKATAPVTEAWIKQVKERNLDGGKMIENARALVAKWDKA